MRENAAWHLRRYRDRALPDWWVRRILEREFDQITSGHSALESEMDELRRAAPDCLIGFATASDLALQRLAENHFELALAEIQRAGRELAELRRCAAVAVDWRRTCASLDGFEALLSPELESQPTVQILRRLRDLARSFLDQGETRKASFVVILLADQIRLLLTRSPGELAAGCERMLGDLEAQGAAATARIRTLGHEGYHGLSERLADDLEAELAVTDRARRAAAGSALGALESDLAAVRQQAQEVQAALTQWFESSS
ncbi:MAG TPA: hypothetical protein VGH73_07765 [Thermoanaerobaculia bacterium]|jgi:hypothetical protein